MFRHLVFVTTLLAAFANALVAPHAPHSHHAALAARRVVVPAAFEPDTAVPATARRRRRASNDCPHTPSSSIDSKDALASSVAIPSPSEAPTVTSSTKHASTTTSAAPAGTVKPSFSNFFAGVNTGQGTFYGTGLGACGITNTDTDFIVAVSMLLFDVVPGYKPGNPNDNPICGQKLTAHYQGKSVTVTVTDRCVACKPDDLDFSPAAFNLLADPAIGRLSGVEWSWS